MSNNLKDIKVEQKEKEIPALMLSNFGKKYRGNKEHAIKNANFKVFAGEFHGFIGANGAGKTTTIKSIIGAYSAFDGEVNIFGQKNSSIEAKKRMGYIPELAKFPKGFTTYQYILYMSYFSGLKWKEAKKTTNKILKDIGLLKLRNKYPNYFSSGQKKKVLLAQALVGDPDILIMDEPAANLDPKARCDFFKSLQTLKKRGKAIFISSHILTELDKFVDFITIVDGGRIVYSGSVEDAMKKIKTKYKLNTSDNKKIIQWLKDSKQKYKINKNGTITIYHMETDFGSILNNFTTKNKIVIIELTSEKKTLDNIYQFFIKYGSVDTIADGGANA